jgi:hypothetical protein
LLASILTSEERTSNSRKAFASLLSPTQLLSCQRWHGRRVQSVHVGAAKQQQQMHGAEASSDQRGSAGGDNVQLDGQRMRPGAVVLNFHVATPPDVAPTELRIVGNIPRLGAWDPTHVRAPSVTCCSISLAKLRLTVRHKPLKKCRAGGQLLEDYCPTRVMVVTGSFRLTLGGCHAAA